MEIHQEGRIGVEELWRFSEFFSLLNYHAAVTNIFRGHWFTIVTNGKLFIGMAWIYKQNRFDWNEVKSFVFVWPGHFDIRKIDFLIQSAVLRGLQFLFLMNMEIWQSVLIILNASAAIFFNGFIFYLVCRNRALRTSFNTTILNACFADIVVATNLLVFTIYVNSASENPSAFCDVTGFVNLLSFVASVTSLAAVSINRYFLVCKRLLYETLFTGLGTLVSIASVWVCSVLISIPPFTGWGRFAYHQGKSICFVDWASSTSYMIFMIGICFCGPIAATVTTLFLILRTNRKVQHAVSRTSKINAAPNTFSHSVSSERNLRKDKQERKITLSILTVVIVFFIAWGPFVVIMFLETLGKTTVPPWLDFVALYFGFLNSTANPLVYLTLNSNFRKRIPRFGFSHETIQTNF